LGGDAPGNDGAIDQVDVSPTTDRDLAEAEVALVWNQTTVVIVMAAAVGGVAGTTPPPQGDPRLIAGTFVDVEQGRDAVARPYEPGSQLH